MNKYIIPVCEKSEVYLMTINANSYTDCLDKLMEEFIDESSASTYDDFINELYEKNILIGDITDIEEL